MSTTKRLLLVLSTVVAIWGQPRSVLASVGTGSADIDVLLFGGDEPFASLVATFSSDMLGKYTVAAFFVQFLGSTSSIAINGQGDPFLEYDFSIENTSSGELDIIFAAIIDIDPIMGGLPVTSTLDVEIMDPGGEGIDTTVAHRGFLQGVDQNAVTVGFGGIDEQITSAGIFNFQVDTTVPEPQPFEGDAFDRLRVALQFVIAPGDTFIIRGNTTIIDDAPLTADFDGDGDVDGDDLAQWEGDFGQNGNSDADLDNDSDGRDFLAWQQQLGNGVAPTAASHVAPEPSSITLIVGLASIGLFARAPRWFTCQQHLCADLDPSFNFTPKC